MAGRTTDLRRELKERFFPFMMSKGYVVDKKEQPVFTTFRRQHGDRYYACSIQWEKYGKPRFLVSLGTCGEEGFTYYGRHIGPAEFHTNDAHDFAYLKLKSGATTSSWFRQDRPWYVKFFGQERLFPPSAVVGDLIAMFGEAEEYLETGKAGPHVFRVQR